MGSAKTSEGPEREGLVRTSRRRKAGQRVDTPVLDAHPLDDIHNTERIAAVWQAAKTFKPITQR